MNSKRPTQHDDGDLRRQGYRSRQDSERLTSRDKMQPVLLDMLTDDEPQKKKEAQVRNLVSHSELRRRVLRDLQWLFNCVNSESSLDLGDFPQVRRSTLNYGIASLAGLAAPVVTGLLVGKLFGFTFYHTFFFIIVPIIGGGIGEGILPLSLAYSAILGSTPDVYVAQLAPAAVLGNIFAIVAAGVLARLGMKRKALSGDGMLIRSAEENAVFDIKETSGNVDFQLMGGGLLVICAFFIVGGLFEHIVHIPGPVLMILFAVLCKYCRVIPTSMETGAHSFYKFVSTALVWPLMIGLGMLYVPLESVVAVFSVGYVVVCGSVVLSMGLVSFLIAPYLKMFPVEAAIVTCCHSGLGGTGDVAILSASNRMGLMPFAQIATRIGGASTVIGATLLLGWLI